jgi:hypothetical protein
VIGRGWGVVVSGLGSLHSVGGCGGLGERQMCGLISGRFFCTDGWSCPGTWKVTQHGLYRTYIRGHMRREHKSNSSEAIEESRGQDDTLFEMAGSRDRREKEPSC